MKNKINLLIKIIPEFSGRCGVLTMLIDSHLTIFMPIVQYFFKIIDKKRGLH